MNQMDKGIAADDQVIRGTRVGSELYQTCSYTRGRYAMRCVRAYERPASSWAKSTRSGLAPG